MRILISVDIEGIAGVSLPEQTRPGSQGYEMARHLMTAEANAAVEGALEGGAEDIWLVDGHGTYSNILFEEVHPRAHLISGKPRFLGMLAGLDTCGPWDGLFLIGYHACAGSFGVLSHTVNSRAFRQISLNGKPIGEAFINSALAGEYNVPTLLVSGDDLLAEEVRSYLPQTECVVVKQALSQRAAVHSSAVSVRAALRSAATRSLSRKIEPHCPKGPFHLEISTTLPAYADCFQNAPGVGRSGPTTIFVRTDSMKDVSCWLNTFSAMAASVS